MNVMNTNAYCVIMAGGLGKRFWPISNKQQPKQFCDIMNTGKSFLRQTFERAVTLFPPDRVLVVTGSAYEQITRQQLPELPPENILKEPFGRNTAPCIAYAAFKIAALDPDAAMVVVPSDHFIYNDDAYRDNIRQGIAFVRRSGGLLTIGIAPTRPETGYGYIQVKPGRPADGVFRVKTFTEKPDEELAKTFFSSGEFLWNAGIFIWQTRDILQEFKTHLEDIYHLFDTCYRTAALPDDPANIEFIYSRCRGISIDFGIMEHAAKVYVIKGGFGWSDVGTWHAFHEVNAKDERGNVSHNSGVLFLDSSGCIVDLPRERRVIIEGIDNCIIAERDNTLMVCHRDYEENIRHFEERLKQLEIIRGK
ncbi:MAG: mannose-1-phosphate guanylyltransferase [Odoribacteraceae bacterium]|jgi:mannose-1-phosphate guanylyltransferase|nr:mannose-1-phosphate guanylyltransferase [Odoribacteraceae bacterium]